VFLSGRLQASRHKGRGRPFCRLINGHLPLRSPPLMVPHDTGSPPDRAARGGYSSIPTQLGSRQLEPPRRATPCPRQPCRTAGSPPSDQSSRQPVGSTAPSRPKWVRDNQSHPAVQRRAVHFGNWQPCGTLCSAAGSSSRTPVGATAPSRPKWVRDNQSHPAVRRRAVHLAILSRVDDSSFLFSLVILPFPGSIIAPPVGTTAQTRHQHASMSHPAVQRRVRARDGSGGPLVP
jgi:hypothetical protein